MLIFTEPPPPQVYGLNTCENVDIYGRPLRMIMLRYKPDYGR